MRVYIAAPWFTSDQYTRLQALKTVLESNGIEFFSPKDENLFGDGSATVYDVLDGNINAIVGCDAVVAITDGKDVGTMWECGYAYAKGIPILYVWLERIPGQKFNLMLAASGSVAYTLGQVVSQLFHFEEENEFADVPYVDEVE
jgi:nucleoside deoxyribosyltransferase